MSQAIPIVRAAGYPAHYFPDYRYKETAYQQWNDWLEVELSALIEFFGSLEARVMASEISVHTRAGYSTVLVPLDGPELRDHESVHPVLDTLVRIGSAAVARPDGEKAKAALAIIHDPAAPARLASIDRHVDAEHALLVVNRPLVDISGIAAFDIVRADESARGLTECDVSWTAAWPAIGAQLTSKSHAIRIANHDWRPIIDTYLLVAFQIGLPVRRSTPLKQFALVPPEALHRPSMLIIFQNDPVRRAESQYR